MATAGALPAEVSVGLGLGIGDEVSPLFPLRVIMATITPPTAVTTAANSAW